MLSSSSIIIPGNAFREGSVYKFGLNITNFDRTFSAFTQVDFVPSSCQFYIVAGIDSFSTYDNITIPAASVDLTISLTLVSRFPNCNDISFFN